MNKFIAEFFSVLLVGVHICAFAFFFIELTQGMPWIKDKNSFIIFLLSVLGYVMLTGLLSTIVSINENLNEIKNKFASMSDPLDGSIEIFNENASEIRFMISEIDDDLKKLREDVDALKTDIIESHNSATLDLSNGASELALAVAKLNTLLDQDWFKKSFLR